MKTLNDGLTKKLATYKIILTKVPRMKGSGKNFFLNMYIAQIKLNIIKRRKIVSENQKVFIEGLIKKAAKDEQSVEDNMDFIEMKKMCDLKAKKDANKNGEPKCMEKKFNSMKIKY